MARLNEAAPPPVESVDALKRRFVRQNRELTKANTTQSLRIRTLELETSRLLSENLALRSQIIALQHQSHQHQSRAHAVLAVKNQLETKLEDLGRLVCALGDTAAADQVAQGGTGNGAVNGRGAARSPDERNWKNTLSLSDVAGGAQGQGHGHGQGAEGSGSGRLPVILEDKYYPRRTMNAEELINLLSGPGAVNATAAADSPDLGPPPVAHFESEEVPIRFDPSSMPKTNERDVEQEDENPVLSANLETRKRRKDGGSNALELGAAKGDGAAYGLEKSRLSASAAGQDESRSSQYLNLNLNPSAKRKLSVREGEEAAEEVPTLTGKDEFVYNRRPESRVLDDGARERENKQDGNVGNAKVTGDLSAPRAASRSSKSRDGPAASTGASVRKALEPKSANTDPLSSPTKNGKHAATNTEKIPDTKKDAAKKGRERDRHRERDRKSAATTNNSKHAESKLKHESSPAQSLPPPPPPPPSNAEPSTELPPKTPASLDLFSPHSSTEPSAPRPDSRDTPPPTDVHPHSSTTTTTDAFNAAGRASRRPRAGVSYAEPNLRDKMRRPTKALADAVGAEERVQRALNGNRAGSESRDGDGGAVEGAGLRTVVIKKENVAESAWKLLPSSDESSQQQQQQQQQQQKYRAGAVTSPSDDRLRIAINGNANGNGNSDGNGNGELPPSVMTARRHRASSVHRTEATDEPNEGSAKHASASTATSVGGTTIAALVAGTARKRERLMQQQQQQQQQSSHKDEEKEKEKVIDEVPETEEKDKLDIYDFHASSEPPANLVDAADDDDDDDRDGAKPSNDRSRGRNGASRASRRHSTMSTSSSSSLLSRHTGIASSSHLTIDPRSKEDIGLGHITRPRPSSRTSGRRRGTLGLDGAGDDAAAAVGEGGGDGRDGGLVVARARSGLDLKGGHGNGSGSLDGDVDGDGDGNVARGRAERVAARRRSMML